jgi:hypothetical protein
MAQKLPPILGALPGSGYWNDWVEKLRTLVNTGTIAQLWASIDFTASNITDIVTRNHNNLQSFQGGTAGEYYHLTAAQHASLTALPTIASGTYTPTLTNVTNISASTAYVCQYMRVGSVVTVSGKVDIDATAGGAIELGMSLPVASNFSAEENCGGLAMCETANEDTIAIFADSTNDRATFQSNKGGASNHGHHFTFTYRII